MQQQRAGSYVFQAAPRAVANIHSSRKKYRDSDADNRENRRYNIMHDRRVVRGTTLVRATPDSAAAASAEPSRLGSRKGTGKSHFNQQRYAESGRRNRPRTPEAVSGRVHAEVQTHELLEELTDRPEQRASATQTDKLKDRPMSPLFIPRLTGVSKGTSIEDGDLFDFDEGVEPILEVLVGKTMERALMEVLDEQELKSIESYTNTFQQRRNIALAQVQQLEEAEYRREREKQQRFEQAEKYKMAVEKEKAHEVARTKAKDVVGSHIEAAMARLDAMGVFFDPRRREIEREFIPWLNDQVLDRLQYYNLCEQQLASIVSEVTAIAKQRAHDADQALKLKRTEELARIAAEKAAKEAEIARIEEERLARIAEKKRLAAEALARENASSDEDDDDDDDSADDDDDDSADDDTRQEKAADDSGSDDSDSSSSDSD